MSRMFGTPCRWIMRGARSSVTNVPPADTSPPSTFAVTFQEYVRPTSKLSSRTCVFSVSPCQNGAPPGSPVTRTA